jgi:hypothetical protein
MAAGHHQRSVIHYRSGPTPLRGTVISTAGVSGEARSALLAYVTVLGGRPTTSLDATCTHLVLPRWPELALSAKYEFACNHDIFTVSPSFLEECVLTGTQASEQAHSVNFVLVTDAKGLPSVRRPLKEFGDAAAVVAVVTDAAAAASDHGLADHTIDSIPDTIPDVAVQGKSSVQEHAGREEYVSLQQQLARARVLDFCRQSIRAHSSHRQLPTLPLQRNPVCQAAASSLASHAPTAGTAATLSIPMIVQKYLKQLVQLGHEGAGSARVDALANGRCASTVNASTLEQMCQMRANVSNEEVQSEVATQHEIGGERNGQAEGPREQVDVAYAQAAARAHVQARVQAQAQAAAYTEVSITRAQAEMEMHRNTRRRFWFDEPHVADPGVAVPVAPGVEPLRRPRCRSCRALTAPPPAT